MTTTTKAGLIVHSDQGVQYACKAYRGLINIHIFIDSISKKRGDNDNTVTEIFFESLKQERLNHLSFMNHQSVVDAVESYIRFYNYKRRYSIGIHDTS
ncbi:MAG: putative transposase [Psychroserpens sp.]|jgi:putative transposase